MSADLTIDEARKLTRRIVSSEIGNCGGIVPRAIERVSAKYGVEQSSLIALWGNRFRKSVKGHVLDKLRQIDGWLEAKASAERQAIRETAEQMARAGHPAAGVALAAAEYAEREG